MIYRCPCCFITWRDEREPIDNRKATVCHFCGTRHTKKELLNWQIDHISQVSQDDLPKLVGYIFKYFDDEIKTLKEGIHERDNRTSGSQAPIQE